MRWVQCRRCQNIGKKRPGVTWVSKSDNERWFVCKECAEAIEWAHRKMTEFNRELEEIFSHKEDEE